MTKRQTRAVQRQAHVTARLAPKVREALRPLSVLERKFVVYYVGKANGNGTLAAKFAGCKGVDSTLAARSSQMLQKQNVRIAIEAYMEAYAMTAVQLTDRVRDLTNVNPTPFYEIRDGKIALKEKIDSDDWLRFAHWIKAIKSDEKGNVCEVVLHNSLDAMKEMAKILKLYSDAPIFAFNLHLQQLSDDDVLKQLEDARLQELDPSKRVALLPAKSSASE